MTEYITRDGKKLLLVPVEDDGDDSFTAQAQVLYVDEQPVSSSNPLIVYDLSSPASYDTSSQPFMSFVDVNTSVDICPANPERLTLSIHNHSDEQLIINCFDLDASTDVMGVPFTQVLQSHDYYELPVRSEYKGRVTAIRPEGSVSNDPVMVTEYFKVGL